MCVCLCVYVCVCVWGGGAQEVEQRSSARLNVGDGGEDRLELRPPSSVALAYGAKLSLVL